MNRSANLSKRVVASVLDYGIYCMFFSLYLIYFGEPTSEGYQVSGLMTLPLIVGWFIYFPVAEKVFGRTAGKFVLNLKVLKTNGEKLNVSNACKRRMMDPLELFCFGIVAIITFKNTELHQRVGDLWANTQVIQSS